MKEDKKKVFIRTMGCQMNVRDSEVVKGLLLAEGYKLVDDDAAADIILYNTCSVRQHAEDKVWSGLGNFKKSGAGAKKPIIGVIGCMAQNYKKEIFKRAPAVDIVCGPSNIDNIALYLGEALRGKEAVLGADEKKRKDDIYHTGFYEDKLHAYVVISEGCDNFCSYCVVPYVRGRLRHREHGKILKEVSDAVGQGVTSITLLGQNVSSYTDSKTDFTQLLKMASGIPGIKSLTFLTSHPKNTRQELFKLMAQTPIIKKQLHLPVQSGSDRVLKAMDRGYTIKKYLEMVDQYRSLVYNSKLSTDIIVGFPKETEKDFEKTLSLVRLVKFDAAYIFKYSPRPNTKAAAYEDDVLPETKQRRHAELLKLQKEISRSKREGQG
jgi:tRNA-2-methylthio-N6-dimethylallyladenosine synthase